MCLSPPSSHWQQSSDSEVCRGGDWDPERATRVLQYSTVPDPQTAGLLRTPCDQPLLRDDRPADSSEFRVPEFPLSWNEVIWASPWGRLGTTVPGKYIGRVKPWSMCRGLNAEAS